MFINKNILIPQQKAYNKMNVYTMGHQAAWSIMEYTLCISILDLCPTKNRRCLILQDVWRELFTF
jgi:hypothetical protein